MRGQVGRVVLNHPRLGLGQRQGPLPCSGETCLTVRLVRQWDSQIHFLHDRIQDSPAFRADEEDVVESERAPVALQRRMVAGMHRAVRPRVRHGQQMKR